MKARGTKLRNRHNRAILTLLGRGISFANPKSVATGTPFPASLTIQFPGPYDPTGLLWLFW
jgi:hypothetical protein